MKKLICLFLIIYSLPSFGQFTKDDTLRGEYNANRKWWNLLHYDLKLNINPDDKFISGQNSIQYKVLENHQFMQVDLQPQLVIDGFYQDNEPLNYVLDGKNAYILELKKKQNIGDINSVLVKYHGHPKEAVRAPWDGGFSWSKDEKGNDFDATSCQGIGASVWWPCKDHMADEADSMRITVTIPHKLWDVSNGKLTKMTVDSSGNRTCTWVVKNPINNYGVNVNIGNYVNFSEIYQGEKGPLDLNYYVLPEHLELAKKQFKDVTRMLKAFEYWFGPYPFYEDGYKLVEVPYLGMEHQSSVTYGNKFKNGYLGRDLSGTGWGLKWDFIIVHESGHEWFANNITYKDIADMWIHEGFTNYSETLFTEYYYGKKAGEEYVIGLRKSILNDKPIIGNYNVNDEGSRDMYNKGGNMLHTIRTIIGNDEKFRQILRGLNHTFYHKTVTTADIENCINKESGIDFSKVFDQYLRTTQVPTLEIKQNSNKIYYRWSNTVPNFNMPVLVSIDGQNKKLFPTHEFKKVSGKKIIVNPNLYIKTDFIK